MAKLTRLATTVTSHEVKHDSLINAFYLDGRSNRFPQTNDLDITLDRTALGFYLNVCSTRKKDATRDNLLEKRISQDQITEAIKTTADIDSVVNDMAENAIKLTGKFNIDTHKRESRPYYSGVIIKESELAAVTLGEAVAFLYRDETLYPLTENSFNFKAENFHGESVENYDIYSAGRAGSIKYSNIAQLRVDDCVILTTNNVVMSLGQKNLLRILDEAYDQQESAELIHEYMTLKHPNEPFQFMMSFVEDIFVSNKKYRGDGFVSRDTQATQIFTDEYMAGIENAQAESTSDSSEYASGAVVGAAVTGATLDHQDTSHQDPEHQEQHHEEVSQDESVNDAEEHHEYQAPSKDQDNYGQHEDRDEEPEILAGEDKDDITHEEYVGSSHVNEEEEYDYVDEADYEEQDYQFEDEYDEVLEEDKRLKKAYASIIENDDYDYDENGRDEEDVRYISTRSDSEEALDFDEDDEENKSGRKVFLVAIILIVLALVIFGATYLLRNKGFFGGASGTSSVSTSTDSDSNGSTPTEEIEESTSNSEDESGESSSTADTDSNEETNNEDADIVNGTKAGRNGGTYPAEYEIQWGDTLESVFENVYGENYNTDVEYETKVQVFNLIIENNPDVILGSIEGGDLQIFAETTIEIPDPSGILETRN